MEGSRSKRRRAVDREITKVLRIASCALLYRRGQIPVSVYNGAKSDHFGRPSTLLRNICCPSSIFMSVAGRTSRTTVHADVRYVIRRLNAVIILMSCLLCISSFEVSAAPVHPVVQGLTQEKAKERGNPRKRARDKENRIPPLERT